jgi:SAM-dependent methyltransferase
MTANWDDFWRKNPYVATPTLEPAYFFLTRTIRETFGSVRGLRIIELGAGRGDISFLLARDGAHLTLVDSSKVALQQSKARFAENGLVADFVLADISKMESPRDFDVSMSFGLVEHFVGVERRRIVEIHKIARLAFISVPNALCPPYRIWKFVLERTGRWPYGVEIPSSKGHLLEEMEATFDSVTIFVSPLWYHLSKKLRLPSAIQWPFDDRLGYQLLACGRLKQLARPK